MELKFRRDRRCATVPYKYDGPALLLELEENVIVVEVDFFSIFFNSVSLYNLVSQGVSNSQFYSGPPEILVLKLQIPPICAKFPLFSFPTLLHKSPAYKY
jgi:hypothetical protein